MHTFHLCVQMHVARQMFRLWFNSQLFCFFLFSLFYYLSCVVHNSLNFSFFSRALLFFASLFQFKWSDYDIVMFDTNKNSSWFICLVYDRNVYAEIDQTIFSGAHVKIDWTCSVVWFSQLCYGEMATPAATTVLLIFISFYDHCAKKNFNEHSIAQLTISHQKYCNPLGCKYYRIFDCMNARKRKRTHGTLCAHCIHILKYASICICVCVYFIFGLYMFLPFLLLVPFFF